MEVVIITTMEPKMSFLQSKYGTPTLTWLLAEAATPAIYQPATGGVQRTEPATERDVNFQVKLDNDDATVQLLYEVDVPAAPLVMRLMLMETFDLAGTMFTAEDEAHIGEHVRNSQAIRALNQQMQTCSKCRTQLSTPNRFSRACRRPTNGHATPITRDRTVLRGLIIIPLKLFLL